MDLQLAKKNAVVTGAASGVGRSIALCLSGEGVNAVISDIAMEKAENAAEECRALGVKAHPVRTDLSPRPRSAFSLSTVRKSSSGRSTSSSTTRGYGPQISWWTSRLRSGGRPSTST